MTNHGKTTNQLIKAGRYVAFLERHLPGLTAFDVGNWTTDEWVEVTAQMNDEAQSMAEDQEVASGLPKGTIVYKTEDPDGPSIETRQMIVYKFHLRETRGNVFELFGSN